MTVTSATDSQLQQIPAMLQQAISLHQRGDLARAGAIYRRILTLQAGHFQALHLAGVIAGQMNDPSRSLELIERALQIDPACADAYCNRGAALRQLRRFDAALASYERCIALKPDHAQALLNTAVVLAELLDFEAALRAFDRCIAMRPDLAAAHYGRGNALSELERRDEALAAYDRAIALNFRCAEAHYNRGNVLRALNRPQAALASYDQAIALDAGFEAFFNRGNVLRDLEQWDAALASYERAIALRPDYAEALCNRGNVLKDLKRPEAALASYERAIALAPDYAEAYFNRGHVLKDLRRLEASLASYNEAIALKPDYADAYCNRGNVLRDLKQLGAALISYEQALAIKGEYAEAYCNRGLVLAELDRIEMAMESYDRAIALKPDYAQARFNRACALLLRGDFAKGWADYEWRWRIADSAFSEQRSRYPQTPWPDRGSIAGKRVLLYGEQGLGDTIQFCRYATLVAELGAHVILQVPRPLRRLLASVRGVSQVMPLEDLPPACDYYCPLMSLPLAFKTALSSIPADVPYLAPDREAVHYWKVKLGVKRSLRVGLVWSGGFRLNQPETWSVNFRRNIPLSKLAALKHPQIEFYTLQKGQPAEGELAELIASSWKGPELIDHVGLLHDFSDTAALIENLDLVVGVDTSTVHVAGALGKPVWILNRFDTCWRWLVDRSDSPWYPTARLYRQRGAGDWDGVVERVRSDLLQWIA
jgi:tetratricopeptide (TPR) repeat protein